MNFRPRILAHIAALLACTPGSGWAQAEALKHDPFNRPALLKAAPPLAALPGAHTGPGKVASAEAAWKPELAAVLVAGPRSAVSIDGRIVRIDEEINGHRLVEVHEQSAVFVKGGKRVTLSLRSLQLVPGAPPAKKSEPATIARPDAPPKQDAPPKPEEK